MVKLATKSPRRRRERKGYAEKDARNRHQMNHAVVALAGTRIDASNSTESRFPPENVPLVRNRLLNLFREHQVETLVCSAACGADLLALDVAEELGMRSRIVLPFDAETFRKTSVIDRPGNWGEFFDRLYKEIEKRGQVVVLNEQTDPYEAYLLTNERILADAESFGGDGVLVVIVWDGALRNSRDITAEFAAAGRARGFKVIEVMTK